MIQTSYDKSYVSKLSPNVARLKPWSRTSSQSLGTRVCTQYRPSRSVWTP